ncbi:TRAP transporter substrate-binding protein [Chloroflexota bacterium]
MKKVNWLVSIVTVLMVFALLLGACAPSAAPAPAPTPAPAPKPVEPIELRYNTMAPPVHEAVAATLNHIAKELEKRTDGRVKMTIFWTSALASPPEAYKSVVNGLSDMTDSVAAFAAGKFPAAEIADIPIGYPSSYVMSHALNDWYNKFKPKEWDEVQFLFVVSPPPASIGTADKPVLKLADMKGVTIRTPGARIGTMLEEMGAVPRPMPITQVYESLSKGNIEGVALCLETYKSWKFDEIIKYNTEMDDISWSTFIYHVVNKDTFNKMTPQDQKTFLEICAEAMDLRAKLSDKLLASGKKDFLALPGREINQLSAAEAAKFKAIADKMVAKYVSDMNDKGLPGAEYVKYLRERIAHWSK